MPMSQPRGLRSWLDFVRECFCCGGEEDLRGVELFINLIEAREIKNGGSTAKYRSLPNPAGYTSYPARKAHDQLWLFNFL